MRIEKINDHQIRCTLNQKDLSDRELRISELAYGTEKAKSLFRDMMQQASYEFGFEADEIPLMIEAIPMYPDTLVLMITKVEDPDELDTRFSHFTESPDDEMEYDDMEDQPEFSLDESFSDDPLSDVTFSMDEDSIDNDDMGVIPGSISLADSSQDEDNENTTDFISLSAALGQEHRPKTPDPASHDLIRIYSFQTLQELSSLAEYLVYSYSGNNTIYKDSKKGCYYLIVHKSEHTPEEFNQICNMICEYGKPVRNTYASHSYYEEHFQPLIADRALQVLASI